MRRFGLWLVVLTGLFTYVNQGAEATPFTVVGSFTPHLDFLDPQNEIARELDSGMVWDGNHLWVGYQASHLVEKWAVNNIDQLNDTDANLVDSFSTGASISGIGWDGTDLWLTKYPSTIQKYDVNGNPSTSFGSPDGASQGLTWGRDNLWIVGEINDRIYQLNTSGGVIDSFTTPGTFGEGLSWMTRNSRDYLWHLDGQSRTVHLLDVDNSLSSGASNVVLSFSVDSITQQAGSQGIAWDGSHLWYSTSNLSTPENNIVYKLDVDLTSLPDNTPIPEPSTILLFSSGILGVLGLGWRQRKKAA